MYFNPRSHERSDSATDFIELGDYISIHAPTRGATETQTAIELAPEDFNPRSHERSDEIDRVVLEVTKISIHAPTRGATHSVPSFVHLLYISIHAPTRGATLFFLWLLGN